jgi:hypothetical protein
MSRHMPRWAQYFFRPQAVRSIVPGQSIIAVDMAPCFHRLIPSRSMDSKRYIHRVGTWSTGRCRRWSRRILTV